MDFTMRTALTPDALILCAWIVGSVTTFEAMEQLIDLGMSPAEAVRRINAIEEVDQELANVDA